MSRNKTAKLCTLALLLALEIILTRFCSITTTFIRVGFGFLPISIVGILYGPLWAAATYAVGDLIGGILFPSGPFFPGFTLTAALTGFLFGLVLHKRKVTHTTCLIASLLVVTICDLLLNTLWLSMLYGEAFVALLPGRIVKCFLTVLVQTLLIPFSWNKIVKRIPLISKTD